MVPEPSGWRAATERALYGPGGFWTREAPAAHFRTSVHASPLFARAVARLLLRVDAALGRPERLDLVDVGAGGGELLTGVLAALDAEEALGAGEALDAGEAPGTAEAPGAAGAAGAAGGGVPGRSAARRLRAVAVERRVRPAGLDPRISWQTALPAPDSLTGLLFANEWLDNVPVDVAETGPDGVPRQVLVAPDGTERLGGPVTGEDARWLERWWPLAGAPAGTRAELGGPRDAAWARAAGALRAGVAVAVDYAHSRGSRPPLGTLTGFREGREVPPVPDGCCDLTAHVALDAVAAAAPGPAYVRPQHEALRALGVTGRRPPLARASTDPAGYVRALAAAGQAAELLDPAGLGGFGWLVCARGGVRGPV